MTQKFTAEEVRAYAAALSRALQDYREGRSTFVSLGQCAATAPGMLTAYADTLSKQADSGRVTEALRTIKYSIQQARILGNDWKRELALIENTVDAALAAQGQGDGKVAAWVEPDVIEAMQPDDDWDGADGVECMLLKERGEKHTVALFTHPAPAASPAGRVIRTENGGCCIEWAAGADMLDYAGSSLYTAPSTPAENAGVPDGCIPIHRTLLDKLATDMDSIDMPKIGAAIRRWVANYDARQSAAPSAPEGGHIDRARFEKAPCYLCGYNGPRYYHPKTHSCAAKYHAATPEGDGGAE